MKQKKVMHVLLLIGMGLMIPCYAFTVLNVTLSPWPLYNRSRLLLAILTLLCTAALLFGMRWLDKREEFFEKNERRVLVFAAAFYFIVQMAMAHALRFVPITDAEQCFTAAQLIVDTGTFGNVERPWVYFTRCSNNLGFVYVLAAIFRFFGLIGWGDRFMQAALVCSLLFTLGLLAGARVVRRMGGVKAQTRMLLLFASCLPMLYCTTELYTDAFSLAFPTMIIYCAMRTQEEETIKGRGLWAVLFALCSFVGAQMRFTAVIASVGSLIWLLFTLRVGLTALLGAALAAVFALGGMAVDAQTAKHLNPEDVERRALPILHYIAMGLPVQEDEGYGQYGYGGWYVFTTSFEDPKERDAALMTEIIDRVYYLRYPNRLLNMMSRKNLSTFGDGTFSLHEVFEADDGTPNNAVKQVIFHDGALFKGYYHLCTALFMAQMILAMLACAQAIFRKDVSGSALFVSLVGAFLLLCIWETRGRYFFQFQMLLLCAGALLDPHRKKI